MHFCCISVACPLHLCCAYAACVYRMYAHMYCTCCMHVACASHVWHITVARMLHECCRYVACMLHVCCIYVACIWHRNMILPARLMRQHASVLSRHHVPCHLAVRTGIPSQIPPACMSAVAWRGVAWRGWRGVRPRVSVDSGSSGRIDGVVGFAPFAGEQQPAATDTPPHRPPIHLVPSIFHILAVQLGILRRAHLKITNNIGEPT